MYFFGEGVVQGEGAKCMEQLKSYIERGSQFSETDHTNFDTDLIIGFNKYYTSIGL